MGLLTIQPVLSLANAMTPMAAFMCGWLIIGNVMLGVLEGWAMARLLRRERAQWQFESGQGLASGKAIWIMTLANLASAWIGMLIAGPALAAIWMVVSPDGVSVHRALAAMGLLAVVLGVATIAIEGLFVPWMARRAGVPWRWAMKRFLGVQVVSMAVCWALAWFMMPHSLVTSMRHDPTLAFVDEAMARQGSGRADRPAAWVYFIAPDGRSVRRVALTDRPARHDAKGEEVVRLTEAQAEGAFAYGPMLDYPRLRLSWRTAVDAQGSEPRNVVDLWLTIGPFSSLRAEMLLVGAGIGGCAPLELDLVDEGNNPSSEEFLRVGWGDWGIYRFAQPHVRSRLLRPMRNDETVMVSAIRIWPEKGAWISEWPAAAMRQRFWPNWDSPLAEHARSHKGMAWGWPVGAWAIRRIQHIGDLVVIQVGQEQICVVDLRTRTIGLLARGREPVVVFRER